MFSFHTTAAPRPGGKAVVSPEGIIHCTDGKYRWVYAFDQRQKPTVLLSMLWKYMVLCAIAGAVLLTFRVTSQGPAALPGGLAAMLLLTLLGSLVALGFFGAHLIQNGPFVCLLFTVDEQCISCQQVKGKTTPEKVSHAIAAWVGGQSQPSLRFYDPDVAHFDGVTSIHADPNRERIAITGLKIYAAQEQFPLVLDFLRSRCSQVK